MNYSVDKELYYFTLAASTTSYKHAVLDEHLVHGTSNMSNSDYCIAI
jgi:hypothetical protein